MSASFKWRRSVGCVALMMTTLVMGAWGRSSMFRDDIHIMTIFGRPQVLHSESGELHWWGWDVHYPVQKPALWKTSPVAKQAKNAPFFNVGQNVIKRTKFTFMTIPTVTVRIDGIVFPYWVITLPLALISACLLLWPGEFFFNNWGTRMSPFALRKGVKPVNK